MRFLTCRADGCKTTRGTTCFRGLDHSKKGPRTDAKRTADGHQRPRQPARRRNSRREKKRRRREKKPPEKKTREARTPGRTNLPGREDPGTGEIENGAPRGNQYTKTKQFEETRSSVKESEANSIAIESCGLLKLAPVTHFLK